MGAKPSSEAQRSKSSQNGHKSTNTQLSRKFVDALVDSTSIDEMLEVVQRRMEHATPQTTSVALRHLTELCGTAEDREVDATWQDDPRFRALVLRVRSLVKSMSNRTCGNVVWAFAKLGYTDATVFAILEEVEQVTGKRLDGCDPKDLANLAWGFAMLGHRPQPAWLQKVDDAWLQRLDEIAEWLEGDEDDVETVHDVHPQSIANTLWAYATLSHDPGEAWLLRMAEAAFRTMPLFDAQGLANTSWALTSIGFVPDKGFLEAFAEAALAQLDAFDPQALSTTLWSFASMGAHPGEPWMEKFGEMSLARLHEFDSTALATTVWGYATLGHEPSAEWLDRFTEAWLDRFDDAWAERFEEAKGPRDDASPQALENTLWAFATLGYRPSEQWMARFSESAQAKMGDFDAQGLATLLWAYATLGHNPGTQWLGSYGEAWLRRAAEEGALGDAALLGLQHRAGGHGHGGNGHGEGGQEHASSAITPQSLSNTLWALATIGHAPGEQWLERFALIAQHRLADFDAHNLANALWALATLGYSPGEPFLKAFQEVAARRLPEFNPHALANTIWGFASLGASPGKAWLERFGAIASKRLLEFQDLSLSNALWALVVLKEHQQGIKRPLALQAYRLLLEKADAHELPDAVLFALFQIDLLLEAEAPEFKAKLPPVSKDVARVRAAWLHRARQAWLETVRATQASHPSMLLVKEVSKALTSMAVPHGVCKLAENGLFSVDILLELPRAGKVALYIDGSAHFVRNTRQPNGTTILRNRLLAAYGWRVVSIQAISKPLNLHRVVAEILGSLVSSAQQS